MEGLVSRVTAWENERGIEFTYDGVRISHSCFRLLEMTELHCLSSYLLFHLAGWPPVDVRRIYQFETGKGARMQKTAGKFSIPNQHSTVGPRNIFVIGLFRTRRDCKDSL